MACFVVGGGEAVAVTAVRSIVKKKEMERGIVDKDGNQLTDAAVNRHLLDPQARLAVQHAVGWRYPAVHRAYLAWRGRALPAVPDRHVQRADTSAMLHEIGNRRRGHVRHGHRMLGHRHRRGRRRGQALRTRGCNRGLI